MQVIQKPYLNKFVSYIIIFNSGNEYKYHDVNGPERKIEAKTPFSFLRFKYIISILYGILITFLEKVMFK